MADTDGKPQNYAYHVGRRVGKYQLESLLGRGGMAEVYKSHHPDLDRALAIKILHPFLTDTPGFIERFRREARAAAALRHANIVQIYDFDVTDDGLYFMVLEYIDGQSLETYLQQHSGPLPPEETLALLRPICSALQMAHDNNMVHRDIKPANILLDRQQRPYLADFGIAQIIGESRLTQSGSASGTPQCMAPEQVIGGDLSPATDIYALGIILYRLLTGRHPYEGGNPATIMMSHVTESPTSPATHVPTLSPAVEAVVLKALAKEPADRYPNAAALEQALATAVTDEEDTPTIPPEPFPLDETPSDTAVPPEPQPTTVPAANPPPAWVWPALIIGALALVGVGFLLARDNQAAAPPPSPLVTAPVTAATETGSGDTAVATDAPTTTPTNTVTPVPVIEGMVFISGGTFPMGNDEGNNDEAPVHEVQLGPYFMDETEVTNAAYAEFVTDTGHPPPEHWPQPEASVWEITATEAYVTGNFEDRFAYDGEGVRPVNGVLSMTVDADNDTGMITTIFTGTIRPSADETYTGTFRIEQDFFFEGPPFPAFKEGGIGDFVQMHGLSGNELRLYPELVAYIGTWGFADVYLNDELLFDSFGVHIMYSDGARDDDTHFIRRANGQCCFSASAPGDSSLDPNEREISIWIFPGTNYADVQDFWFALYFNDVTEIAAPASTGDTIYPADQGDYPVTHVSWDNAAAFCQWRDGRLPTEAEWEYAARGPDAYLYPWGDEPGAAPANTNDTLAGTAPVGNFPQSDSPFGLQDMAGNVWEWTADWYDPDYYARAPAANPTGPNDGNQRVARGGGFRLLDILGLDEARSTHRLPLDPEEKRDDVGFRCARSAGG